MQKIKILSSIALLCISTIAFGQNNNAIDSAETGVSVSPSNMHFNAKPGTSQIKTIKITNDTRNTKKFQVNLSDYGELDNDGKTQGKVSSDFKYALSKWLSVSPTYIEVAPREAKTVTVTLEVPNGDSAAIAAWTMVTVDQVKETKKSIEIPDAANNSVGMGVNQVFGFGIYVYQNPPNVINNRVEINSLKFNPSDKVNQILMGVKNAGDGIGFCNYYVEITNMGSGKTEKISVKRFTILPGYNRELKFDLPAYFPAGKYSAVAVLDFGSKDDLQTAELEFEINK